MPSVARCVLRLASAQAPLGAAVLSVPVGTILRYNALLGQSFQHLTSLPSLPLEPALTRHSNRKILRT